MIQEIIQSSLARELTMRTISKLTFHDRIEKGEILVKCKYFLIEEEHLVYEEYFYTEI